MRLKLQRHLLSDTHFAEITFVDIQMRLKRVGLEQRQHRCSRLIAAQLTGPLMHGKHDRVERCAEHSPFNLHLGIANRRIRLIELCLDGRDITKGIPERFRAIERFLERYPRYRGELTCVEIGAPSRGAIPRYQEIQREVTAEAERINRRFATSTWQPIVLLVRHHEHAEIEPYYRDADVCLVTSLHDGMNLVAKEFVAARSDDGGVLVLSRFAGAADQLRDALIVNPYDVDQVAEAILLAIEMDPAERRGRMRRMRSTVMEHNVYRWAGDLIRELTDVTPSGISQVSPGHTDEPPATDMMAAAFVPDAQGAIQ